MLILSSTAAFIPLRLSPHAFIAPPERNFSSRHQRFPSKLLLRSRVLQNIPALKRGSSTFALEMRALIEDRSGRRLVDIVRRIPALAKDYFKSPFRRSLFGGISLLGGFYVAQTISLSFGALGANDVMAAILSVLFAEYVTRFYHSRKRPSFPLALLNNFKMGFSYGLFIDAFKLAS